MIRRQLMFELAEIYSEMMDLKLMLSNRQADTQSLDSHTVKKFNHLCSASAKWVYVCDCCTYECLKNLCYSIWYICCLLLSRYFQMFLDSLCSPEGKVPEHLEEEVLRPALVARFRVARLYGHLISTPPSDQLENLDKSLDNYKYEYKYFLHFVHAYKKLSGLHIH